jgi:hypothetical protein
MTRKSKFEILKEIQRVLHTKEYSDSFTINEIAKKIKSNWSTTKEAIDILEHFKLVHIEEFKNETFVIWL